MEQAVISSLFLLCIGLALYFAYLGCKQDMQESRVGGRVIIPHRKKVQKTSRGIDNGTDGSTDNGTDDSTNAARPQPAQEILPPRYQDIV